ncbi:hypothetical protein LCGC14_1415540 [marine sediment metagenome]|uniref:Uncharacterized protein n=1 Tax=marine sediment metagenome TaxID=412755 RepID=A0A0F9M8G0_9ZZZZ
MSQFPDFLQFLSAFDPRMFLQEGQDGQQNPFANFFGQATQGVDPRFQRMFADFLQPIAFRSFQQDQLTSGLGDLTGDLDDRHNQRQESLLKWFDQQAQGIGQQRAGLTQDVVGGFQGREQSILDFLDPATADLLRKLGERTGQGVEFLDDLRGDVSGGFGEFRERSESLLEGGGEQARKDINRRFDQREAEARARLRRQGLGSSSVVGNRIAAIDEARDAELARLDERLRREKLGVETGLSRGELASQERLGLARSGTSSRLSGEELSAQERLTNLGLTTRAGLSGDTLSAQERLGGQEAAASERLAGTGLGLRERLSGQQLQDVFRLFLQQMGFDQDFLGDIGGLLQQGLPGLANLRESNLNQDRGPFR